MTSTLSQQRDQMRAALLSAWEDKDDPFSAYDDFVQWTLQNYSTHAESGLLELLEETVRKFKDDIYKAGDFRYVKLWLLFAKHVSKPVLVYAYMLEKGIGKPYAIFFEEYANALELEGRFGEAETVITLGMRTQATPTKRFQGFRNEYNARRATGEVLPERVPPFKKDTLPPSAAKIYTDPLHNITSRRADTALSVPLTDPFVSRNGVSMAATQAVEFTKPVRLNPYAHLNAPQAPGKRPEKLRFDLTLLLDPDGTEYCFEEARARHLGLLGKKWPPPPPPNVASGSTVPMDKAASGAKERSMKVDFNDQGTKTGRGTRRQSVTVTINTKQALEDVFDMYNSSAGENATIEEVKAEASDNLHTPRPPAFQDENAGVASKPRAFQPCVDQRRENVTPGPLKFVPVTTKTPGLNSFTPNVARKALATKEIVTPVPAFKVVRPEQKAIVPPMPDLQSLAEEKEEPEAIDDVFGGDEVTTEGYTEEFTNPPRPPAPRSFVPFIDENTSSHPPTLPPTKSTAAPTTSKILKFQVHRDENALPPFVPQRSVLGERKPLPTSFQPMPSNSTPNELDEPDAAEVNHNKNQQYSGFAMSSGRFASFDVMTPITERTFEFTTSTRGVSTPGGEPFLVYDKGFVAMDAQDVAEKLAAELHEEVEQERTTADGPAVAKSPFLSHDLLGVANADGGEALSSFDRSSPRAPFRVSEGFTIEPNHSNILSTAPVVDRSTTVNIAEVGVIWSDFELPNPCIPSDPEIKSKLLSFFHPDPKHRDLDHSTANQLEKLQRFVEKRNRRGSGASGTGRLSDGSDKFMLDLDGDRFEIYDKLGEGGFGAVFMAKELNKGRQHPKEGVENSEDEDEDEEDDGLVAVKVVRPTNLWESYVLRRILAAVPDHLGRSIITPHNLYAFKDESFLVLDLCQQGTLLEIVNRATETGVGQPGGGVDELLVMFFTVELLRLVEGLHDRGFIHGDLKIDNCLIRLEDVLGDSAAWSSEYSPTGEAGWACKGIRLIDFGRTIDTKFYPPEQMFIADWKTDARDCVEIREGRPWTFQTDYYGLASIIYCMLFGKYIETVETSAPNGSRKFKPAQPMKRYWQVDLWNRLFDALLNPCQLRPDQSLPVTEELSALRGEIATWMQVNCNKSGKNLKGMLKKIEIATLRRAPRK